MILVFFGSKALDVFKSTIVHGSTPFDNLDLDDKNVFNGDICVLRTWLMRRKNAMLESMFKDMREAKLIGTGS